MYILESYENCTLITCRSFQKLEHYIAFAWAYTKIYKMLIKIRKGTPNLWTTDYLMWNLRHIVHEYISININRHMLVPVTYVAIEMQPACPKITPHQHKEDKILIVPFICLRCWHNIISSQSILIASTVKTWKTKQPTIPGLGCTYAYIKPAILQKYCFKTAMAYFCSSF